MDELGIIKNVINKWLLGFNKKYSIISYEVTDDKIIIYTQYPGVLIGCHSNDVNDLSSKLKQEGIEKEIEFVELGHMSYQAKRIIRK